MLSPIAFANSQAIVSRAVCLALYVLAVVWRDAFRFVFNAQSLGADVASLLPHKRAVLPQGKEDWHRLGSCPTAVVDSASPYGSSG